MNTITFDKSEFTNLKDCKVGEALDLDITVTAVNGDTLTATVDDANYADAESDQADTPPNPDKKGPVGKIGMPMMNGRWSKGY